jgi:hypothetical protein
LFIRKSSKKLLIDQVYNCIKNSELDTVTYFSLSKPEENFIKYYFNIELFIILGLLMITITSLLINKSY